MSVFFGSSCRLNRHQQECKIKKKSGQLRTQQTLTHFKGVAMASKFGLCNKLKTIKWDYKELHTYTNKLKKTFS